MINRLRQAPSGLAALLILCLTAIGFASDDNAKTILVFGDSLTAGYGVGYDQAYPKALETLLEADDLNYSVIPSGVSGETSAGGLRRIDWVMRKPIDLFILALGANDGLRGIAPSDTHRNLIAIIERVRLKNPDARIVIAAMLMPPNLGKTYTEAFANIYPEIAAETESHLIPFLLEGVAGNPSYNLADGIHPNVEGHQLVARHVFDSLLPLLAQ